VLCPRDSDRCKQPPVSSLPLSPRVLVLRREERGRSMLSLGLHPATPSTADHSTASPNNQSVEIDDRTRWSRGAPTTDTRPDAPLHHHPAGTPGLAAGATPRQRRHASGASLANPTATPAGYRSEGITQNNTWTFASHRTGGRTTNAHLKMPPHIHAETVPDRTSESCARRKARNYRSSRIAICLSLAVRTNPFVTRRHRAR
jgi:hypothetical protein